jgi:hypothetical protein
MPPQGSGVGSRLATALLVLIAIGSPVLAHPHHAYVNSGQEGSSHITCETVRAFVSQVGLVQARAIARANGMQRRKNGEHGSVSRGEPDMLVFASATGKQAD